MSYSEAKVKYAACGVDAEAAIEKLKTVPHLSPLLAGRRRPGI